MHYAVINATAIAIVLAAMTVSEGVAQSTVRDPASFETVSFDTADGGLVFANRYGDGVHILADPFLTTHLARLCSPETHQPQFNELVSILYTSLIRTVINTEFPRTQIEAPTRMIDSRPSAATARGTVIGAPVASFTWTERSAVTTSSAVVLSRAIPLRATAVSSADRSDSFGIL